MDPSDLVPLSDWLSLTNSRSYRRTHIDLAYEGSGKATIQLTMCRNASIVLELFRGHFALIGR